MKPSIPTYIHFILYCSGFCENCKLNRTSWNKNEPYRFSQYIGNVVIGIIYFVWSSFLFVKENNNNTAQTSTTKIYYTTQDQQHSLPYWKTVGRIYFRFCLSHMISLLLRQSNNKLCNIVCTHTSIHLYSGIVL